jgi:hypothetical protein
VKSDDYIYRPEIETTLAFVYLKLLQAPVDLMDDCDVDLLEFLSRMPHIQETIEKCREIDKKFPNQRNHIRFDFNTGGTQ